MTDERDEMRFDITALKRERAQLLAVTKRWETVAADLKAENEALKAKTIWLSINLNNTLAALRALVDATAPPNEWTVVVNDKLDAARAVAVALLTGQEPT